MHPVAEKKWFDLRGELKWLKRTVQVYRVSSAKAKNTFNNLEYERKNLRYVTATRLERLIMPG